MNSPLEYDTYYVICETNAACEYKANKYKPIRRCRLNKRSIYKMLKLCFIFQPERHLLILCNGYVYGQK